MEKNYQFKKHLQAVAISDVGIILLGEGENFLLQGALYYHLCPLINGENSIWDLAELLNDKFSMPEVFYTIELLVEKGYLVEVSETTAELGSQTAFWETIETESEQLSQNFKNWTVSIENLSNHHDDLLSVALTGSGAQITQKASLRIVLVDDYLDKRLQQINHEALQNKQYWLPVKLSGRLSWVGPIFQPDLDSNMNFCWACLAHRVKHNRPVENFVQRQAISSNIKPPLVDLPISRQTAANFAALSIARWIATDGNEKLNEKLLTLNHIDQNITEHTVVKRPQCPVCGTVDLLKDRGFQAVTLQSKNTISTEDGGYRCLTPEQTYELYRQQISPITGVLSNLEPLPARDHPLRPVYAASHFTTPITDTPDFESFHQFSLGKGRSRAQARASAMCEGIERWSAIFQGDEPRIKATFAELGNKAIHPNELLNYSVAQYQNRDSYNATLTDPRRQVPLLFDEQVVIDWTPLWSLTQGCHRYVPTAYCYSHTATPEDQLFCRFNSNGHAAGNCLEEAILQGFLELVERDGIALWWYNRIPRPAVDLNSFSEVYLQTLQEHYQSLGWQLWVLDLTTDLQIPIFAALAHQQVENRFCVGFGCHLDKRLGVQRALTELNQLFDPHRPDAPWDIDAVTDITYLFPERTISYDYANQQDNDLLASINCCLQRAKQTDLEVLVLDQTRPDVGLAVAKIVAPGLRHFWPRFGTGRLYETPVNLGWLKTPLTEPQLNSVPLWL